MPSDEELFDQIGPLVERRQGWKYAQSSTPGASPFWTFESEGEVQLTVSVANGAISIYVPERDREMLVGRLEAFAAWIEKNDSVWPEHAEVPKDRWNFSILRWD